MTMTKANQPSRNSHLSEAEEHWACNYPPAMIQNSLHPTYLFDSRSLFRPFHLVLPLVSWEKRPTNQCHDSTDGSSSHDGLNLSCLATSLLFWQMSQTQAGMKRVCPAEILVLGNWKLSSCKVADLPQKASILVARCKLSTTLSHNEGC